MILSDVIRTEFLDYRKCDILWACIANDDVKVRMPHYDVSDDIQDTLLVAQENDTIPIVNLEIHETIEFRKRCQVSNRDRYFLNNNMWSFLNEFRKRKDNDD